MARNIEGMWQLNQTNAEVMLNVDFLTPARDEFKVDARDLGGNVDGAGGGRIEGFNVDFTITWMNGTKGRYQGTFDADNFLFGSTFDVKNPGSFAGWRSAEPFS